LEDLGIDGRIILKWFLKGIAYVGVGWIDIAQARDWRQVLIS
jgi:hypothetical protein